MNRLFLRFFVLVMLSITVATGVIYLAFQALFGDPLDQIAARQAAAQIFLLEQYIDKAPVDEWLLRLNKVREVSNVNLEIITLAAASAALPAPSRAALQRGEVVIDAAHKAFYRRVDLNGARYVGSDDDVLHAQDLPIDVALAVKMEAVRYVIVALALLIPIALWSRSHWRQLQHLSDMADDFGQGRLDARASLPRGASIYPLAERINHMAGRIEHLLGAQRSLLQAVSHELRTPIARLEFALELLRSAARDPALERRIGAMEGDVRELNALVSELLGMARLEHQQARPDTPFALDAMLLACCAELPPAPGEKHIACRLAPQLGQVRGDPRLLARAVGNLLRNALKYADGRVELSAERRGENVDIVVEDDGPGIPEDERERIFTPFYRLDRSRDRASGGFGLGLAIAQRAVAVHRGTLRVERSALGGARFVISLVA
jgi:two-component system, OmpR family, sensor kinase